MALSDGADGADGASLHVGINAQTLEVRAMRHL